MTNSKYSVTVSPHLHDKEENIRRAMVDVLIALVPAAVFALIVFGMNAFYITAVSVITAVLTEYVMRKIMRRKVTLHDYSAVVTGVLFAFILPPTTPLWVVAIGSFIAVAVAKELFGGLGKNIFNPALFARIILLISPLALYTTKCAKPFFWKSFGFFTPVYTVINGAVPGRVTYNGLIGNAVHTVTCATPLSLLKSGKMLATSITGATPVGATWVTSAGRPNLLSMFLGFEGGAIGEISVLALLIGGAYLIYRRTIDWRIPTGILCTFFLVMLIMWNHPLYELFGGGLFLGAFFMATDWVTSPVSKRGKWIYAIGIGLFIALIRLYSPLPEGVAIAILHWNVFTLLIDRYIAVPKFGDVKKPIFNMLPKLPKPLPQVSKEKG
ncbi:MAG: RnfABCDGE type electron transport complex subunit D [Actinobacteria bacterium]|nr:RnfABCDGE type electron transport complex subunit D [Actinomycetota bacterium]